MIPYSLSILIFLPIIALLLILFMPDRNSKLFKYLATGTSIVQLGLVLLIWSQYNFNLGGINEDFQFVEHLSWININLGGLGYLKIDYFLGVDGLSFPMILLSAIVLIVASVASWKIEDKAKGYFVLFLLLNSAIMGCFLALDFFLFYLFFELMLLPMYFLIGLWGGPRREYASIKFFLFTLFGSIFILLAVIALYFSVIDPHATAMMMGLVETGGQVAPDVILQVQKMLQANQIGSQNLVHTFNIVYMMEPANYIPGSVLSFVFDTEVLGMSPRLLAFLALFIGFAIKLPAVPVHTWLPDAHVEAPTAISVILAGILLKVGAYGIFRTAYSIFPEGAIHFAWFIGLIGVISILYGAFNALAMRDLKKIIAYSSVSHMGFVLLGMASLTSEGIGGSMFQMFSHGILSSLLFVIAGIIYDRTSDRMIDSYRGLATRMPMYTTVVTVAFFASLGLPGFSGFIGELFILIGSFRSPSVNGYLPYWMTLAASGGLILGAAYYLWALQRMFFGKFWSRGGDLWYNKLKDLTSRELMMTVPLIVLAILFGIFPGILFDLFSASAGKLVDIIITKGNSNLSFLRNL